MDKREHVVKSKVNLLEDNIIEFIAVTEQYVPKEILPNLAEWGAKQPVIYRHEHPAKGWGGQILGRTLEAKVAEDKELAILKGRAQMFDNTDMQKMAIEYIKKKQEDGNPVQISIGYQEFIKDDKIVDVQIYEYSLTHIPVCTECVVSIGELEMNEEVKIKKLEGDVKDRDSTINELQVALDEMSGKNKELEGGKTKMETKIHEYEEKYVAQKDEVSKLNTRVLELEDNMRFAEVKPKVEELVKLYEDPDLYDYFKGKALEKDGSTWIDKKLEAKKGKAHPAPIVTQHMNELEGKVTNKVKSKISHLEQRKMINTDPGLSDNTKRILIKMLEVKEDGSTT